jgi:hypothetical protein
MNLFEIISLRRSGHHAFINWLFANLTNSPYEALSTTYAHDNELKLLYINQAEFDFNNHQNYINTN